MKGRKRQWVVDSLGMLLRVSVQPANLSDARAACFVFEKLKPTFECLTLFWADRAYRGWLVAWVRDHLQATRQMVAKPDGAPFFVQLPRRSVIERTLAWLGR